MPGSTLSLGDSGEFQRSDLSNPYHEFIELNYGTKVVTSSIHINLGIDDVSLIICDRIYLSCDNPVSDPPGLSGLRNGSLNYLVKNILLMYFNVNFVLEHHN